VVAVYGECNSNLSRHEEARAGIRPGGAIRTITLCLLLSLSVCACYQYFRAQDIDPLPQAKADVRIRLNYHVMSCVR
jgi:hypothetical protein